MKVFGINRSYLNSDMDEVVTVKFLSRIYKLMELTSPEVYCKYLATDNRKTVLCIRLRNKLYVCLKSAILFYK